MKNLRFLIVIYFITNVCCKAQDIHFSQLNNSPLIVNPSLSGEFHGNGRFILNYRNQWRSITNDCYKTYAFSADHSFFKEKLSAGLFLFKDQAGDGNMSLSQINLSVASKVKIGSSDFLKLGIQGVWSQKHLDMNNLTWNSQFDGRTINSNLNSGEINYNENYHFLDIALGVLSIHKLNNKGILNVGFSAFHLNKPNYYFLSNVEKLRIRWNAHADISIPTSLKYITIYPSFLFMKQVPSNEINLGGIIKYNFGINSRYTNFMKSSNIFFGAYYRYRDAIILYVKYEFRNQLDICLTYDINISGLKAASDMRGGTEISLIYIIPEKTMRKL